MDSEDIVLELAQATVFNDFTDKNKVGAITGGIGALCAIGALISSQHCRSKQCRVSSSNLV
jgi:hypothetical protein